MQSRANEQDTCKWNEAKYTQLTKQDTPDKANSLRGIISHLLIDC